MKLKVYTNISKKKLQLLILQLLRPALSNLPYLVPTFHIECPSVLLDFASNY